MSADLSALNALAAFLPIFEAPGFRFVHNDSPLRQTGPRSFTMVGYQYDPQVWAFWDCLDERGWLSPFDWMAWLETAEARELRERPRALEQASAVQLSQLLTMTQRQERFGDGAWVSLWDSGLLLGIVRRAAVLAQEAAGP